MHGGGGGALYLVAGTQIAFTMITSIDVSGAGGAGTPAASVGSGAGGGGAGGMLVLYAPMITVPTTVILMANGGGGGSASPLTADNGSDPTPTNPNAQAPGGTMTPAGGRGFAAGKPATQGAPSNGGGTTGGGGGGGGGGYIRVNVAPTNATASPALTIIP
jgi:hypothetical protein